MVLAGNATLYSVVKPEDHLVAFYVDFYHQQDVIQSSMMF